MDKNFLNAEFEFSGHNAALQQKMREGEAIIGRIDVLYKDGEPERIHVSFPKEDKGYNVDVYLTGKALEDYLSFQG